jgi:hypothetical protein
MTIVKESRIDCIEVLSSGILQIRQITEIKEDGQILASSYHRHVLEPGADYSSESPEVIAMAEVIHTPEKIAEFIAAKSSTIPQTGE